MQCTTMIMQLKLSLCNKNYWVKSFVCLCIREREALVNMPWELLSTMKVFELLNNFVQLQLVVWFIGLERRKI
jgi:hypothetical protein